MSARSPREQHQFSFRWRSWLLLGVLSCAAVGLLWRAVHLQLIDHTFLVKQGDERTVRVVEVSAHRGTITDRHGEPLAVSTPVDSVWADPRQLAPAADQIPRLARALGQDPAALARRITSNLDREFLYLARHLLPTEAQKIRELGIPGVKLMREYRRYYPAGEVTGHVLGFTNVDDAGQEGLELAFDHWLAGENGAKRIIRDLHNRSIDVESVKPVQHGRDLVLSIDLRIQYLAYRELKSAIRRHRAHAGSVVVLDVNTGEVLAMVNQPAYNPNDRQQLLPRTYRNRAVTDIFEPGSVMKPFVIAAALASGKYTDRSLIDTSPGFQKVGSKVFEDQHGSLGRVDLATILAKSSNVGMARVALSLEPQQMWTTLHDLGFGQVTTSGYPGESAGLLSHYSHWRPIGIATMSHGYGLSVTPLQLASAYATLGAFGERRPVSFLRVDEPPVGEQVLSRDVCRSLLRMLERVVAAEGTGVRAAIHGYRVSGKTGTAWKAMAGGYATDRYMAVFGGVAPATAPRLAAVVVIDEPGAGAYYGGEVAAPVFSAVVGGALRLLAVPPDADRIDSDEAPDLPEDSRTLAQASVLR